jgi:hypothetical protein
MNTKKRAIIMVLATAVVCSFAIGQVNAKPKSNPRRNVYFGEQPKSSFLLITSSNGFHLAGNRISADTKIREVLIDLSSS